MPCGFHPALHHFLRCCIPCSNIFTDICFRSSLIKIGRTTLSPIRTGMRKTLSDLFCTNLCRVAQHRIVHLKRPYTSFCALFIHEAKDFFSVLIQIRDIIVRLWFCTARAIIRGTIIFPCAALCRADARTSTASCQNATRQKNRRHTLQKFTSCFHFRLLSSEIDIVIASKRLVHRPLRHCSAMPPLLIEELSSVSETERFTPAFSHFLFYWRIIKHSEVTLHQLARRV